MIIMILLSPFVDGWSPARNRMHQNTRGTQQLCNNYKQSYLCLIYSCIWQEYNKGQRFSTILIKCKCMHRWTTLYVNHKLCGHLDAQYVTPARNIRFHMQYRPQMFFVLFKQKQRTNRYTMISKWKHTSTKLWVGDTMGDQIKTISYHV